VSELARLEGVSTTQRPALSYYSLSSYRERNHCFGTLETIPASVQHLLPSIELRYCKMPILSTHATSEPVSLSAIIAQCAAPVSTEWCISDITIHNTKWAAFEDQDALRSGKNFMPAAHVAALIQPVQEYHQAKESAAQRSVIAAATAFFSAPKIPPKTMKFPEQIAELTMYDDSIQYVKIGGQANKEEYGVNKFGELHRPKNRYAPLIGFDDPNLPVVVDWISETTHATNRKQFGTDLLHRGVCVSTAIIAYPFWDANFSNSDDEDDNIPTKPPAQATPKRLASIAEDDENGLTPPPHWDLLTAEQKLAVMASMAKKERQARLQAEQKEAYVQRRRLLVFPSIPSYLLLTFSLL